MNDPLSTTDRAGLNDYRDGDCSPGVPVLLSDISLNGTDDILRFYMSEEYLLCLLLKQPPTTAGSGVFGRSGHGTGTNDEGEARGFWPVLAEFFAL